MLSMQEVALNAGDFVAGGLLMLVLLILSSLFSGSEVALFTLDPSDKEDLEANEDAASKRVVRLLNHPRTVRPWNSIRFTSGAIRFAQ